MRGELIKKDLTYILLFVSCIIPFVFYFCGIHTLLTSKPSIIIESILLTLCLLVNITSNIKKDDAYLILLTSVFLIISVLINGNLGVALNFYNVICWLLIVRRTVFSSEQVKRIRAVIAVLLIGLLFSLRVVWQWSSLFIYKGDTYINPNTYGILWLALCFTVISRIELSDESVRRKRFLSFFIIAVSAGFIWMSGCRTALIALAFFLLLCFMKKMKYKAMFMMLLIVGIVLPFIYVYLAKEFENIQFMGKYVFSGRQGVWESVWQNIMTHPLLGIGSDEIIDIGSGKVFTSAHNTYWGYWSTIGIIPMISFVVFLFKVGSKSNVSYLTERMILATMFVCTFETLYNDANYNFLFILLLMKANNNTKKKEVRI